MAANLDALCDMLDAEISDEEEEKEDTEVVEAKDNADRSDSQIDDDVIAGLDEVSILTNGYKSNDLSLYPTNMVHSALSILFPMHSFLQPFEEEESEGNPDMANRIAPSPPPNEQAEEAPPDDDEDEQSEMERQLKQMQEQVMPINGQSFTS